MDQTMQELRMLMTKELDEIVRRGELDENSLVCIYKMVDILKDIGEIESAEQGYSQANYSMYPYAMTGNSYNGNSYNGNSYNGYSGRGRDRMGRFTSNSYDGGMSNRGYSRGSEKEEIMSKMEHMMANASSETERQAIQRIMNQL